MTTAPPRNRLAEQTSPYLLQHASNPVAWLAWGEEAFAEARARDVPILLSIGYSACHWCHVMEHESFADPKVAALINPSFVAIKVDREERPDVDAVYMAACQAMNGGRGGWPLTVLLTPTLAPFFAGTYFPPADGPHGPGFTTLLRHVAQAWQTQRKGLEDDAAALAGFLQQRNGRGGSGNKAAVSPWALPCATGAPWLEDAVKRACEEAAESFDAQHGGFGAAPKFLATPTLQLLLRCGYVDADAPLRPLVTRTLAAMTRGGLYDLLGGGFSRYSTDAHFRVPHFEKMLYDNALMARLLLDASQATGEARWASYARQTLEFVATHLRHEDGGFFTAIDADSEGVEGRFYTWPWQEAYDVLAPTLGDEAARRWLAALGMTAEGNWEDGRNILFVRWPRAAQDALTIDAYADAAADAVAVKPDASTDVESGDLAWPQVRALLEAARSKRVAPTTDDKILLGLNGLMVTAFARAACVFADTGGKRFLQFGCEAADFCWRALRTADGAFKRSWRAGAAGEAECALEDCAYFAQGLLALYEAGAPAVYLARTQELVTFAQQHFVDANSHVLYDSHAAAASLLFRPVTEHDTATPSPAAVLVDVSRRLAVHTGEARWQQFADATVAACQAAGTAQPQAHATLLACGLDGQRPPLEIVWVGEGSPHASPLWRRALAAYLPHAVFAHGDGKDAGDAGPLLAGREGGGAYGTVYVCEDRTCLAPLRDLASLARALPTR